MNTKYNYGLPGRAPVTGIPRDRSLCVAITEAERAQLIAAYQSAGYPSLAFYVRDKCGLVTKEEHRAEFLKRFNEDEERKNEP